MKSANWLSDEVKAKMEEKLPQSTLTKSGEVIVRSELSKSRMRNESDAIAKLGDLIRSCLVPERPEVPEEVKEKIKAGKERAEKRRMRDKRDRSMVKAGRNKGNMDW